MPVIIDDHDSTATERQQKSEPAGFVNEIDQPIHW